MRLCHNTKCSEVHSKYDGMKAKHVLLTPPEIWCSITCAVADGGFSVRTGYNKERVAEILKEYEGM